MKPIERRSFIKGIARMSAYSAPVVYSVLAPPHLMAQVSMMGMEGGMDGGGNMGGGGGNMGGSGMGVAPAFPEPPG